MNTITCTPTDLAAAFTEWERRYREEPERFTRESERLLTYTPETYGEACAPYFLQLLREAGTVGGAQAHAPARKEHKVIDLSYSQDTRQHLKDVAAYHADGGWRLVAVVRLEAPGRWLYYLERDEAAQAESRPADDRAETERLARRLDRSERMER